MKEVVEILRLFNSKGFSMVETLASIVIITFVFTIALTIIVNLRKTTLLTNERVVAVNLAKRIRDDIENDYLFDDISDLLISNDLTITNDSCVASQLLGMCDLFEYTIGDSSFNDKILIKFLELDDLGESYGIIHFFVEINYYEQATISIEGVIYE